MRLQFEWRKWVKLPKNKWVFFILVALFIGGLFQVDQTRTHQVEDYLIKLREGSGRFLKNERDTLAGFFGEELDLPQGEYEELIELYNQAYDTLDAYYRTVEEGDERQGQAYYLEFIKVLENIEAKSRPIPSQLIEDTLFLSKAKMAYLQEHDLVMEESLAHPTGLRTVLDILLALTSVAGMCGFLLLFYDFFSFEYEHQQIRLIYTQPIQRHQLVLRKLFVVAGLTLSLVVGALLLALFFGRFVSGEWGSLSYPVMLTQVDGGIEVFTMGKLLVYGGVHLILALLVTLILVVFFSYATKKSLMTLLLTATVLFILVVCNQVVVKNTWLQFTPLALLSFRDDYQSLMVTGKLFRQTLLNVGIMGVSLFIFCLFARVYLKRLAKEEAVS